jgi:hypothetical protein
MMVVVQLCAVATLRLGGKSTSYLWVRRVSGPQSQFVHCGEEKNPCCAGNQILAVQLVASYFTD